MSIGFASFKQLKLPISTKLPYYIANCLYLHDRYITRFDFMNYAFAKLLLARLFMSMETLNPRDGASLNPRDLIGRIGVGDF